VSSSTTDVTMPQMGVSVAEGTVAAWHKRVGDRVSCDETICEISTDKIDTDVPAPAAGRVVELLVGEGETVAVGTVLARIELDALPDGEGGGDARASGAPAVPAAQSGPRPGAGYSPVVRRIAAEHGIDLSRVVGTGRDGRVRKEDVLAAVDAGAPRKGAEPAAFVVAADPVASPPGKESVVREPLSRMRRAIAEHMTRSLRTAAHCTTIIEVDMSRVEAARVGAGLSPLPYVAWCTVASLGVFGRLNATLEGDVLTRYGQVDLGVAVSLGERGLIVPVIRAAEDHSVAGLAHEIGELARRARADELRPDETRGATFTITNPGRWGTIGATPIISQPQVAILDLEAVVRRPVVVGGDGIAIRPMGNLCLSWDHRALDGVMAAEFLADVRARIEGFEG
jgi:pyruvate/2-oxoglutarate dehydrogenase complex dihydrolipoamide acyltransferase (E2) component